MFSKKHRIPRDLVKKVISEGQKGYSELFLFKKLKNNLTYNRFTIVVSKKVSNNAVTRNLIKRKIKSALKVIINENNKNKNQVDASNQGILKKYFDLVLIVSPAIKNVTFQDILKEIRNKKVLS